MAVPSFFPSAQALCPHDPKTHHIHMFTHWGVCVTIAQDCENSQSWGLWHVLRTSENYRAFPMYIFAIIWVLTPSLQKVSCSQVPRGLCVFLLQLFLQRTNAPSWATDLGGACCTVLAVAEAVDYGSHPLPLPCSPDFFSTLCLALLYLLAIFLLLSLSRSFHLLWRLEARDFVLLIFVLSLPFLPTPNISHNRTNRLCLVHQHVSIS